MSAAARSRGCSAGSNGGSRGLPRTSAPGGRCGATSNRRDRRARSRVRRPTTASRCRTGGSGRARPAGQQESACQRTRDRAAETEEQRCRGVLGLIGPRGAKPRPDHFGQYQHDEAGHRIVDRIEFASLSYLVRRAAQPKPRRHRPVRASRPGRSRRSWRW